MFLPMTAPGLVSNFIYQTMTTQTLAEKQGQFIISMQAMGTAARAHADHHTHVPANANSEQIMEYGEELLRLHRLEKG